MTASRDLDRRDDPSDTEVWLMVSALVAIVLLAAVAFVVWGAASVTTCGGDGGSPYAAPGSSRAHYCDLHMPLLSAFAGWVLAAGGALWSVGTRRWSILAAATSLGVLIVTSPLWLPDHFLAA